MIIFCNFFAMTCTMDGSKQYLSTAHQTVITKRFYRRGHNPSIETNIREARWRQFANTADMA